jgi:hypothetical protein
MLAATPSQDLAEDFDGVRGQIRLAKKLDAGMVIADDVPSVDGEFVAQMRYELSHDHLPPGPWNDGCGLRSKDLIEQRAQAFLFDLESSAQWRVFHRPEGSLTLFERPGFGDGVASKIRLEVANDFRGAGGCMAL